MLKIDEITSGKATKFGTDVKVVPSFSWVRRKRLSPSPSLALPLPQLSWGRGKAKLGGREYWQPILT